LVILAATLLVASCTDPASVPVVLTADLPLHLEDHFDKATIEGSEVPDNLPEPVEWRFDEPQPEWKTIGLAESQKAHQALAQRFTPGEEAPLTPEQLRTLRALGYIN